MPARISPPPYYFKTIASPVGKLRLVASDQGLAAVLWEKDNGNIFRLNPLIETYSHSILNTTHEQLMEYFSKERTVFTLPLEFKGTPFQQHVWQALLTIPYGQIRTYGQIASQIGHPKAVRAVGAANGRNPISIIAPCHRVIGANNTLTGFGGGVEVKKLLLNLEGITHINK